LSLSFGTQQILYFKYLVLKLFDLRAKDYYNINNPVVKILLPKMNYEPHERAEVISQAYQGLYELASPLLFDKYLDFIDIYAEVQEEERVDLYNQLIQKENTVMLAQYIKDKGREEGRMEGRREGRQEGRQEGEAQLFMRLLALKFGHIPEDKQRLIESADSQKLRQWSERILTAQSLDEVLNDS